jgi:TonB family protein
VRREPVTKLKPSYLDDEVSYSDVRAYADTLMGHLRKFGSLSNGSDDKDTLVAVYAFRLRANGTIADMRLVDGSGNRRIDEAARSLIRRAVPLPPIPSSVGETELVVRAPIRLRRS